MHQNNRPLIAVSSDYREFSDMMWHATPHQYLKAAVEVAHTSPLLLPNFAGLTDMDALLDVVDGIMITGSRSNVHPSLYDTKETPSHEPYDRERDASVMPLIRKAIERGLPLLAICRGLQELNVALGGSLATEIQNIEGRSDHRGAETNIQEEKFALAHDVKIAEGSCLAQILKVPVIQVNSVHRQAIDQLAPSAQIEAIAPDGTIEAISVKNAKAFTVGLQWHPEFWATTDNPSRLIFEAFGDAVRAHQQARTQ